MKSWTLIRLFLFTILTINAGRCQVFPGLSLAETVEELGVTYDELNDVEFSNIDPDTISFLLYDKDNQTTNYILTNSTNMLNSTLPTKIIIHGWLVNATADWVQEMAYAYHQEEDCNVVAVDWSEYSETYNYLSALSATQGVGFAVGIWILEQFRQIPTLLQTTGCTGHSFGGQICGFAGKKVQSSVGQNMSRISALDLAGLGFETPVPKPPQYHLTKEDANFVDVYHTTAILLGVVLPYGHVDFYINYEAEQLNCSNNFPNLVAGLACRHGSAYVYFTTTISNPGIYVAVECSNVGLYALKQCNQNEKVVMGEWVPTNTSGKFYINIDENGDAVPASSYTTSNPIIGLL